MQVGDVILGERPLLLAPMEDVTDQSFRLLCREYGASMVYTEFVNADGLVRGARKLSEKMEVLEAERPVGIQLYGQHLESMVHAVRLACELRPEVVDLNFGCPVKKIAGRGAGAGMLRDLPALVAMAREAVKVANRPVTVKTRLGWDADSIVIEELALQLQDVGVAALTVHARTRAQLYSGKADWSWLYRLKSNPWLTIPIVGNGDIATPQAAKQAFEEYHVDGVMVGRATYGKPWLFREMRHYIDTGELLQPAGIAERVEVAKRHLELSVAVKGERRGIFELRRHLGCYFKGLPDFRALRLRLLTEESPEAVRDLIEQVGERYADWQPQEEKNYGPWGTE